MYHILTKSKIETALYVLDAVEDGILREYEKDDDTYGVDKWEHLFREVRDAVSSWDSDNDVEVLPQ